MLRNTIWDRNYVIYSFGISKLDICDISKFNVQNNDSVIFCFGEIDCRCHVHKHITNNKTYEMIMDEIINNYIDAIKINIDHCHVKLKNICIYNVVPTVEKHNTKENPQYPYVGTNEERQSYVLYFNQCLKHKCLEKNWIFFDIYNFYIDSNGFLKKELSDGNVHIKNGIFLQKFIDNNFYKYRILKVMLIHNF